MKKYAPVWIATTLFLVVSNQMIYVDFKNEKKEENTSVSITQNSSNSATQTNVVENQLKVEFLFKRGETISSNQIALWIEDKQGNVVKTIGITRFAAEGGFSRRRDILKNWVTRAKANEMSRSQFELISSPTPSNGQNQKYWNGVNDAGNIVLDGEYTIFLEGTLYLSSNVVYSQDILIENGKISLVGDVKTVFSEETQRNRDMITNVKFGV